MHAFITRLDTMTSGAQLDVARSTMLTMLQKGIATELRAVIFTKYIIPDVGVLKNQADYDDVRYSQRDYQKRAE